MILRQNTKLQFPPRLAQPRGRHYWVPVFMSEMRRHQILSNCKELFEERSTRRAAPKPNRKRGTGAESAAVSKSSFSAARRHAQDRRCKQERSAWKQQLRQLQLQDIRRRITKRQLRRACHGGFRARHRSRSARAAGVSALNAGAWPGRKGERF